MSTTSHFWQFFSPFIPELPALPPPITAVVYFPISVGRVPSSPLADEKGDNSKPDVGFLARLRRAAEPDLPLSRLMRQPLFGKP